MNSTVRNGQRRMLDAVAAVFFMEHVDLRSLEVRAVGLVVRELHAAHRVPHHHRAQSRAALVQALLHVVGVELHLPEALETEHMLEPEQRGRHGLEVGGDVVEVGEAAAVAATARRAVPHEAGVEREVAAALHEAKRGVAERRRDHERLQT
jgi:hypothetical protein